MAADHPYFAAEWVTPHAFRRSFATDLVNVAFVCEVLAELPRKNCWTISPAPCARGDLASHPAIAMRTELNLG